MDVNLREYNRIFTGTNQDYGYDAPFFSYSADTTELILGTDKITYFHYPFTAPSGLLIDSSLVDEGAVFGNIPYASDKIWKKMANYSKTSVWGNAQPESKQTGVWLCSWLSGDPSNQNTQPVWKDRWYNPGYIDAYTAMFINTPQSGIIIDIDSEMTFEGGSYYKYFHVGSQHNQTLVDILTTNNSLKLHLEDWSETPIDLSPYNNTTTIVNYDENSVTNDGVNYKERPNDTCLNLNGINQYAQVLYSNTYNLTGDMTFSFWAYTKDWSNTQGSALVSKDHRGGWCVKYNNGFETNFVVVADSIKGKYALINTNGDIIAAKTLPTGTLITSTEIDTNMFVWILDNGLKRLYKSDLNTDLNDFIQFDITTDLTKLSLDEYENICVLDTNTSRISAFNRFTNEFIGVKSGLLYTAYSGNHYLSGMWPPDLSAIPIIRNGYYDYKNAKIEEIKISNTTNYPYTDNYITTGIWLGQQPEDFRFSTSFGQTWKGKLVPQESGVYTFVADGDDYIKLFINNVLVASSFYFEQYVAPLTSTYNLNAGTTYDVFVDRGEWQVDSGATLKWKTPSMLSVEEFGKSKNLTPNSSGVNNFTIDLSGNVVGYECTDLLVDNNNNQWVLKDNKLYKNMVLIDNISATKIMCNKDNDIWLLSNNIYWKLDGTTYEKISGTFTTNQNVLDFTNEYYNGTYIDFLWTSSSSEQKVYKMNLDGTIVKIVDLSTFDISPTISKMTSYDWNRKFNYLNYNKQPQVQTHIYHLGSDKKISKEILTIPTSTISNDSWHLFTVTINGNNINYYMDSILRDTKTVDMSNGIYYEYENPLLIGTNVGKTISLGEESNIKNMYFNGKIDDLRIYDRSLNNSSIRYVYLNKFDYTDLIWNIDTGKQDYIEEIVRFFKFKLPGQKSPYFNINIVGLKIYDEGTRSIIENIIKDNVRKLAPAYAELYKIIWK